MRKVEEKRLIEAALFMSSKPLSLRELSRLLGVAAPGYVESRLKELAAEYDSRGSAIEVYSDEGKYSLRLRAEYSAKVKPFAQEAEISRHALRTLAYIAQNEGIAKSLLRKRLGDSIYQHVQELAEKGFLHQEKSGRTTKLTTTAKFKTYFQG